MQMTSTSVNTAFIAKCYQWWINYTSPLVESFCKHMKTD